MMDRDLPQSLVRQYDMWTETIQEEDLSTCGYAVFEALLVRSDIAVRWSSLSVEQQNVIATVDARLVAEHEKVAEGLNTFVGDRDPNPLHWWYRLDEGPQVRAEAEQAAKEAR